MKLFGDVVIDKGKDIIKNAARGWTSICGYFVFYIDINTNVQLVNSLKAKLQTLPPRKELYVFLVNKIVCRDFEYFRNENYEMKYLRYIEDDPFYEFSDIDNYLRDIS